MPQPFIGSYCLPLIEIEVDAVERQRDNLIRVPCDVFGASIGYASNCLHKLKKSSP